ncbi:MAG: prepilin-type N-terminal cleavage/methylation domain-containing protein [Acidobacteriota bacterium]|jgi:prepilin-type N-terminal cleavage/methylation domain-containing protein
MRRQAGFSMVELMVAMTVTLIVSAAIYGLLTSGSTAFRREPEMADRQQNIRVAMDLIGRDVFNAGSALPTFAQVFSRTDPAGGNCTTFLNGCGVEGSLGSPAAATRGPGDPGGDGLTATDVLEIVATDETCPSRTVCSNPPEPLPGNPGLFIIRETLPACVARPGVVMMTDGTSFTLQMSTATTPSAQACPNGGNATVNGRITLGGVLQPWVASPPLPAPSLQVPPNLPVIFFYAARVVRYRIAPSNDPLDSGPALWRSRSGRYGLDGIAKPEPGDSGFPGTNSPWELVARGIEDLQVEYMGGDGLWHNNPPISVTDDWSTLVRQVRITLSARASAPNLQGATSAAGTGPDALRGQLVTVVAPRAAFNELQMGNQIQ